MVVMGPFPFPAGSVPCMDALARAAAEQPGAPAIVHGDRVVTYAELDRAADGVADLVTASGSIGSHAVAFWGDRSPHTVAAVWGIPRAGVDAVPVDPSMTPGAAMDATRVAGVRGLWVPPDGGLDRLMGRVTRPHTGTGGYVVLTSGTEGNPRGVRITPENVTSSVAASQDRLGHGPEDSWLCVLPLFHVGGLSILWRQAEAAAPVVLHDRFDADAVGHALGQVAFASLVPVMLRRVLSAAGHVDARALRAVLVGGAASDPRLLQSARDRGIPAIPTYGMTETTSQIATPSPDEPLDGTVGTALPGAAIRVMADGESVVGTEGRIEVAGPMVSPGYAGEPPRRGEWHRTGDLGVLDDGGRLTVLGRADAVIVTGGENVHPLAVETALRSNAGIRDIRVSGEPDEEWGQVVVAEVETDLGTGELDELAAVLPAAMRPRRWTIVPTVRGKLDV